MILSSGCKIITGRETPGRGDENSVFGRYRRSDPKYRVGPQESNKNEMPVIIGANEEIKATWHTVIPTDNQTRSKKSRAKLDVFFQRTSIIFL